MLLRDGGAAALAGRVGELQAVSDLLSGETRHAAMLIMGEAGVGKTRLVAAASETVGRADTMVVSGWCLPLSEGLPFLPMLDVLRTFNQVDAGRLLESAQSVCPPFVRAEVRRLLPELVQAHGERRLTEWDDGWGKQRLFEALRCLFDTLAGRRRFAIVIEDVHWVDSSTVELLEYLLAPGRAVAVPVVLTCRSEESVSPIVKGWLDRLQRNPRVRHVDLAPLSEAETGEQIALLLGARPPRQLVPDTYARSERNAFFTEQLVAAHTSGDDDVLPAGLTSLLLSRTGQVTGGDREVLAALAVAAQPLSEANVARMCQLPDQEVRDALRNLLDRRLLRRPDDAGRHQIRHALLAEAISSELLPTERADFHGRMADMLAEGPARISPVKPKRCSANGQVRETPLQCCAARPLRPSNTRR